MEVRGYLLTQSSATMVANVRACTTGATTRNTGARVQHGAPSTAVGAHRARNELLRALVACRSTATGRVSTLTNETNDLAACFEQNAMMRVMDAGFSRRALHSP
jgi:hypothetical protein